MILTVLFLLLLSGTSFASVYHVALTGSDSNSGTSAQPFRSIQKGVNTLGAGDTLTIHAGTYNEAVNVPTSANGTSWSAPTRIQASPGDRVVIAGSISMHGSANSYPTQHCDTLAYHQYYILDGIILDGTNQASGTTGLGVGNCSRHVRFQNGEIFGYSGNGWSCTTPDNPPGRSLNIDCQLVNSKIHDIQGRPSHPPTNRPGLYFAGTNFLIEGNEFYNNTCCGITLNSTYDAIVHKNRFHNNGERGMNVGGSRNKIYNNLFYNDGPVYGAVSLVGTGNFVWNNTFYNNAYGVNMNSGANANTVQNNLIANSVVANIADNGVGTIFSANLCERAGAGCALVGDPRFVNPGALNFHLQSGSPAIDRGIALTEITADFDGNNRSLGVANDIGAYEFTGTFPVPVAPTGLSLQ